MDGVELTGKAIWSSRWDDALVNQLTATATIDTTNPYFQSIAGETPADRPVQLRAVFCAEFGLEPQHRV